ncbi:MAG: DUF5365 family protein [Bacillus sp. (in: firmicutes)]
MKVVYASTPTQAEKINELIQTFYSTIFPYYFSDDEIQQFSSLNILKPTAEEMGRIGTLKVSYQIITALQTIISILEVPQNTNKYKQIFAKNVQILRENELCFPFELENFKGEGNAKEFNGTTLSIFSESTNSFLI